MVDPGTIAITIALLELLLEKGPEAYFKLIRTLPDDNPTPEQIRALKVKMPEAYEGD